MWAILSNIDGNLAAYKAVLTALKRHRNLEAVYILGNLVGPQPDCEALVTLAQKQPQTFVCMGWWEEQAMTLHGMGSNSQPEALVEQYGSEAVEKLWKAVPRSVAEWLQTLDLGYFEENCMLIHGTTLGVNDLLTPKTPVLQLLDRLIRSDAEILFCGRSGEQFEIVVQSGSIQSAVVTLNGSQGAATQNLLPQQVIGVGSVGRIPGEARFALFDPNTRTVKFQTVSYGANKGFAKAKVLYRKI
jgi:hypothetical protein